MGGVLIACEKSLQDDFFTGKDGLNSDKLDVLSAKNWFENEYIGKFSKLKVAGEKKGYVRKTVWDKAMKTKDKKEQECLLVPIAYEGKERPMFIAYGSGAEFKSKLPSLFAMPIIECLVVGKEKGKHTAYIIQVAYDKFKVNKNADNTLNLNKLNGYVMNTDWDDSIQEIAFYENGTVIRHSSPATEKKARSINQCYYYTTQHISVTGSSCGPNCHEVNVTLTTTTTTLCFNEGGYPSGFNPNAFEQAPPDSGGGAPEIYTQTPQYNLQRAICAPGQDRNDMNTSLAAAASISGLTVGITSWSLTKAEALAKSLGAPLKQYFPLAEIAGKKIGGAAVIIDGISLFIGWYEDSFQWEWDKDLGTAAQVILGVGAIGAAAISWPWVAVSFGIASIGLAVYAASNTLTCD